MADLLLAGQEHLEKFELDQARDGFNQAAIEAKGYLYDRLGNGLIYEQQLFYHEALNEYLELSVLFPDSAMAYGGIYRIFTQFGYHDTALFYAARYFELSPESKEAALYSVQGLLNARKFNQAIQLLESPFGRILDEKTAYCLKAQAFCYLGDFDSLDTYLGRAFLATSKEPFPYALAADVVELTGKQDSAMALSRLSASSVESPVSALYRHFYRALGHNYYADARRTIKLLEQKGAWKEITTALNVMIAKDQKNFTKSRILDSDYLMATPRNVSSLMFDMDAGGIQFLDAILLLSQAQAIKLYMDDLKYNTNLKSFVNAQILLVKGESDLRVEGWMEISKLNDGIALTRQVKLGRAYVQYRTGQFDEALKNLKELRAVYQNQPDWLTAIADIYAHPSIKVSDEALTTYDEALKSDKWYKTALINKVQFLRSLGRHKDALSQFEIYPHFDKKYSDIALLKAICLAENNEFAEALELFVKNGSHLKGNLEPFRELANVLKRKYRDEEPLQLGELCAGWAGDNADILIFAARLLADGKNFAKADELADKALAIEPGFIEPRVQKGRAWYGLGKRTEAFELLDGIMKEDPSNGDVNYYYSKILAGEKLDRDRTTNMARSALRAFYSDEEAFINICEVYTAFGEHKYAYGDAIKGTMEHPSSARLWYQLGLGAHNMGRANAEENLKKAIELGLGGGDLKTAQKILAEY